MPVNIHLKKEEIKQISRQYLRIKAEIDERLKNENPTVTNIIDIEIRSIIISLKKMRFKSPGYSSNNSKLYLIGYYRYLTAVIPLLRDGHYREARREATRQCEISEELKKKIQ